MSEMPEFPRLTSNELTLLRSLVRRQAPELLPAVSKIEARTLISNDEAEQLEKLLTDEMLSDYSDEAGLSQRGIAIDHIVGKTAQYAPRFHSST